MYRDSNPAGWSSICPFIVIVELLLSPAVNVFVPPISLRFAPDIVKLLIFGGVVSLLVFLISKLNALLDKSIPVLVLNSSISVFVS